MEYKHSAITKELINAAMEVHNILGNGFQEVIYQRAYFIELEQRKFKVAREVEMPVAYKGVCIGTRRADFLINDVICIEVKAVIKLENVHLAQALNYLEAYHLELGLLINFGAKSLEFNRLYNKKFIHQENGV